MHHIPTPPQPFYGPFSGTTRVSRCQKRTSALHGARKINRGRHIDHPAGCHSIGTNQCPSPPSLHAPYTSWNTKPTQTQAANRKRKIFLAHSFYQNTKVSSSNTKITKFWQNKSGQNLTLSRNLKNWSRNGCISS